MVFYFTATGNSLYAAKLFSDMPVSIPQIMRTGERVFSDREIGIVFPVFAGEPPKLVLEFLKESKLNAKYLYLILTYGFDQSDAPEFAARMAEECGHHVDYAVGVKMVDNYLPMFDMEEEIRLDKQVEEQLAAALRDVSERKRFIPEATQAERELHARVAEMNRQSPAFNDGSQIMVKETCVGCGICERVCPIGNFYVENGRAKRKQDTCEFCLACAQNCPQKAIGLTMADKNPTARYRNEHISLSEIIAANENNGKEMQNG